MAEQLSQGTALAEDQSLISSAVGLLPTACFSTSRGSKASDLCGYLQSRRPAHTHTHKIEKYNLKKEFRGQNAQGSSAQPSVYHVPRLALNL